MADRYPKGIQPDLGLEDQVTDFLHSITPDLYSVDRFIDWEQIERNLEEFEPAILVLEELRDLVTNPSFLAEIIQQVPLTYRLLAVLLSIPQGAGFSDGRELTSPFGKEKVNNVISAELFNDLGIERVLRGGSDIRSLLRLALIGQDAARRRYRVESTFENRVHSAVLEAMVKSDGDNGTLQLLPRNEWVPHARDRVSHIIAFRAKPILAVASVFQTATGGRQIRDLNVNIPSLRDQLAGQGIRLAVIADGRGLRAVSPKVVESAASRLGALMTLRQAEQGQLFEAIEFARHYPLESAVDQSTDVIIERLLRSYVSVSSSDLSPLDEAPSRVFASYIAKHPELKLDIASDLSSISWRDGTKVKAAQELISRFEPGTAVKEFADVLDATIVRRSMTGQLTFVVADPDRSGPLLPEHLLIVAHDGEVSVELLQDVAKTSLRETPESHLACLLVGSSYSPALNDAFRARQTTLTANVIIITTDLIWKARTGLVSARDLFAQQILNQADLVKSSPFILNNATPDRMFYGRDSEEASLVSILSTNSVALLGARRIGKTSLMRHTLKRLEAAGVTTYFGDCQNVGDWNGFGKMAKRYWNIEVPSPFEPESLEHVVDMLSTTDGPAIVILLDEIDHLLSWDLVHSDREVPEAFFRTCRAISQKGKAHFVFSGERMITTRLWDAESPHWNFCTPIMLRQLSRDAAEELIIGPLLDLGIQIEDRQSFADLIWKSTSGHPQIVQFIGDCLIKAINTRLPINRVSLSFDDLSGVLETYAFAEHYLETYWGQATPVERVVSLLIGTRSITHAEIKSLVNQNGFHLPDRELHRILRMLELYGFIDSSLDGYRGRLSWLDSAVGYFGGYHTLIGSYREELNV